VDSFRDMGMPLGGYGGGREGSDVSVAWSSHLCQFITGKACGDASSIQIVEDVAPANSLGVA
jgi:hypothetical protein